MQSKEEVSNSLRKVLDSHGYSFQYSVVKKMVDLRNNGKSPWNFVDTEIPVTAGNKTIHYDFLFVHQGTGAYLIGECKRANPALSCWTFTKSPFVNDNIGEFVYFDSVKINDEHASNDYFCRKILADGKTVGHLPLELRTNLAGDANAKQTNTDAISSASTQVLRASSGLFNHMFEKNRLEEYPIQTKHTFIPVVFTTADLWYTDSDISQADIETGLLPSKSVEAEYKEWLWYNHNRSRDLMPNITSFNHGNTFRSSDRAFTRSIAIVNPKGIEAFLKLDWNEMIYKQNSL